MSAAWLCFLSVAMIVGSGMANKAGSKPNVLILFADDMGVADLGVLGHPTISSPNLDKIANGGVRFTAWYSGFHICSPSRAAMMTGRLCVRSGTCGNGYLGGVFSNKPVGGLPTNETTVATALKSVGYTSKAIGKWHLGTKDEYLPTGHGFDHYYGIPFSVDMGKSAWSPHGEFPPLPLLSGPSVVEQPVNLDTLSVRYAKAATDFITNASEAKTPWLLYLAANHVHTPDFVSQPFCGKSRRGLFGDAVEELDWMIGQVMGAVESAGQKETTIVFFSSDNGPWTSHHLLGGSAGPFRDGKGSVWEGGVREPGFVYWPGTIQPRIESEPVATYDIFPTVLGLAGVPLPAGREFDGRDMMPLLLQQTNTSAHKCIFYWKGCTDSKFCGVPEDSPLANKKNPGLWAVRCGSYKTHFMATNVSCTVKYMPPGIYQERPLIYRIDVDPSERFPLTEADEDEYNEQLAIAKAAVTEHIASLKPAPNQIALGSDDRIVQDGGAALCGCPNKTVGRREFGKPDCMCDPDNMKVFVCEQNHTLADIVAKAPQHHTAAEVHSRPNDQPNIVMLFIDDSGYGDYGVYGAPSTDTPNVDRMASAGARFTQWYTAHAICTPSRAALMTGRLPVRYGLASTSSGGQAVFGCAADMGLPRNETTMAELLKGVGYQTHMIGKWHLGSVDAALPTNHGFDSYYGVPYSVDMGFAYNNRTEESWSEGGGYYGCNPLPLMANLSVIEQPVNLATLNERYTEHAISLIEESTKKPSDPYFLYFAFGHVHTPQYAGVSQAGKSKRGIFGDSVAEVDASIGRVLEAIGDSNTIVIMSSDNGAPDAHQHLQPGQVINSITGSNHMFLGSKTQTWEGGIREPGIVWWPGKIAPQVRRELVSTMDVFATVAEVAGAPMPSDRVYDSYSMLPLLLNVNITAPRSASFFYAGTRLQAVRVGSFKAHLFTDMPNEGHAGPERNFLKNSGNDHSPYGQQNPWLLFDVEKDPSEMFPIKGEDAGPILSALAEVVAIHRAQLGVPPRGVLDSNCPMSNDCRVCCDHSKQCSCTPPPTSNLGLENVLHVETILD